MGDDRAGANLGRFGGNPIHEDVVVVGVVVEHDQGLHVRRIGQAHALRPGRGATVLVCRVLVVGIGTVVDHDIGAVHQLQDVVVKAPGLVLGIGDVGGGLAVVLHPIAGRAV